MFQYCTLLGLIYVRVVKNMPFSILPPSNVFKIYFALLKSTTREQYTSVSVLLFTNLNPDFARKKNSVSIAIWTIHLCTWMVQISISISFQIFVSFNDTSFRSQKCSSFIRWSINRQTLLVELALAERDSKTAGVSLCVCGGGGGGT